MKKPFLHALSATLYIVFVVLIISVFDGRPEETILIPMTVLALLVLSVAVMGFLFVYEPLRLFIENKRQEAVSFFGKTIGFFACFIVILLALSFVL